VFVLTRKNYDRKKRYSCHLAGYVFWRVQITTGKNYDQKKSTVVWPSVGNWKKLHPEKKVQLSGRRLEHKTQNTTHIIDTTTNKMSRATLPSSGFAPSLSMGGAVAPPNHGAAAPQRHAQAATRRGCARCCWFACLGRQNGVCVCF
jgi:hypothetical protein